MQAKKRLALTVVGITAVVMLASSSHASAAQPEICMTPNMSAEVGQQILCSLRNAFAYGTMQVVLIELFDGAGTRLQSATPGTPLLPLATATLAHTAALGEVQPYSCRFTVVETVPSYVRAVISRLPSPSAFADTPGYAAQCNPF